LQPAASDLKLTVTWKVYIIQDKNNNFLTVTSK